MSNHLSSAIAAAMLICTCGCSPQSAAPAAAKLASVNDPPTAAFSIYDAPSLVEIPNFANLPDGVKALLSHGPMSFPGEGPDGRCCVFLLGGVSSTSALVAYEIFAEPPSYRAIAFAHSGSGWVEAAHWNINAAGSFPGLKEMTARSPDY